MMRISPSVTKGIEQLTFHWKPDGKVAEDDTTVPSGSPPAKPPLAAKQFSPGVVLAEASFPTLPVHKSIAGSEWDFRDRFPMPTSQALAEGLIDLDPSDFEHGSVEALKSIHEELRLEWLHAQVTLQRCRESQQMGVYPETGKQPRTEQARLKLRERLEREIAEIEASLEGIRSVYIDVFGFEAADAFYRHLEAQFRDSATEQADESKPSYPPNHPWHYLAGGDARDPMPASEIPRASIDAGNLGVKMPKDAGKRASFIDRMLREQQDQLNRDTAQYEQLIKQGVAALSTYDRNIAYSGNDELALASAYAMKFSHIAFGKARVSWLTEQQQPQLLR